MYINKIIYLRYTDNTGESFQFKEFHILSETNEMIIVGDKNNHIIRNLDKINHFAVDYIRY